MRYICQTLFDITVTGVTGHFKLTRLPYIDQAGQQIDDQITWNRSRNQQRNWETLTQILGLRTQLFDLTRPIQDSTGTCWSFEFETETAGTFGPDSDPCHILLSDANGVPMLRELNNNSDIEPFLCTTGPRQNIWFAPIDINNKL
jgi:hypothetical protein